MRVLGSSENPSPHELTMNNIDGHPVVSFTDSVIDGDGNIDFCNVLYVENDHAATCSTGDTPGVAHQGNVDIFCLMNVR